MTGKQTIYIPDVFILYQNRDGDQIAELIEIKPSSQSNINEARSARDKASFIVNQAKWAAAQVWCKKQSIKFRVITERELFVNGRR